MDISVIIPIYNEADNLLLLCGEIKNVFINLQKQYELIFVNDGSSDNSLDILKGIMRNNNFIRVISFDKNYGKTAALEAGFKSARGEIILTIDGDLQHDPADLIKIIEELRDDSIDMVMGRRVIMARGLVRKLSSQIADFIRSKVLDENYHDCALAGYKKRCLTIIKLYDGFEYVTPVLLKMDGYSYKEIGVRELPRKYGKSKYSNIINRTIKGICILCVLKWMKNNKLKYTIIEDDGEFKQGNINCNKD